MTKRKLCEKCIKEDMKRNGYKVSDDWEIEWTLGWGARGYSVWISDEGVMGRRRNIGEDERLGKCIMKCPYELERMMADEGKDDM